MPSNSYKRYSLSRSKDLIHICNADDILESASFHASDGTRVTGTLEIEPNEVLFMAWRQKKSPSISDKMLRKQWETENAIK